MGLEDIVKEVAHTCIYHDTNHHKGDQETDMSPAMIVHLQYHPGKEEQ